MPEAPILDVAVLGARYGDLPALWDVSLQVAEHEVVALIGPNGAGKTTLLRAVAGLHRPSAGQIKLRGAAIDGLAAHRIVDSGVILVPEGRRLFGGRVRRRRAGAWDRGLDGCTFRARRAPGQGRLRRP